MGYRDDNASKFFKKILALFLENVGIRFCRKCQKRERIYQQDDDVLCSQADLPEMYF